MNEPIHAIQGYYSSGFAPGLNLGTPYDYITAHNLLLAHARVFRLYDKKYRSKQNGSYKFIEIRIRYIHINNGTLWMKKVNYFRKCQYCAKLRFLRAQNIKEK